MCVGYTQYEVLIVLISVRVWLFHRIIPNNPYKKKSIISLFIYYIFYEARDDLSFFLLLDKTPGVSRPGHERKISEIFATWLSEGAPTPVL